MARPSPFHFPNCRVEVSTDMDGQGISQPSIAGITTINCLENDWQRGACERKSANQQNAGAGFERHNMSWEAR